MRVGAPFNPYRVFQGAFAPYWILEHRGISAGAKLCYIRLLGFAGKDARCYPSLQTLGVTLGVSERQARDYVKELERMRLIAIEQRGLRKTNVYLFLWTEDLDRLNSCVPERPDDPNDPGEDPRGEEASDRNSCSGLDRDPASAPDRNNGSGLDQKKAAGLERNRRSGPIGIISEEINPMESSSSSASENSDTGRRRKTSDIKGEPEPAVVPDQPQAPRNIPHALSAWAMERGVRRLRTDRRLGWPEEEQLNEWAAILERSGVHDPTDVFAVLDVARAAADRSGAWHNWSFLTLQVQLAAERFQLDKGGPARRSFAAPISVPDEDPMTEWAKAKEQIRGQIPEIPFLNWFNRTRQIGRCGTKILVEVPDQPTRSFLEAEYAAVVSGNLAGLGVDDVSYVAPDATAAGREGPAGHPRLLLAVK